MKLEDWDVNIILYSLTKEYVMIVHVLCELIFQCSRVINKLNF